MKITLFCLLLALSIALGKPYYEDEDDDEYEALQDMPDDYFEENLNNELDAGKKSKVNLTKKPSAKKPGAKKPAAKKPAAKKPAAKKPAAKKPAAKKPAAKKPAAKKPAAKKPAAKKSKKKPPAKKHKNHKPRLPTHHCQRACVIFRQCLSSRVHNNRCHMAFAACKRCTSGRHRG